MKQNALKGALRTVLQRRRAMLNPADYGFTRLAPQGRRPAGGGLSQTQVDDILGFGRGTYERLENGRYNNAPEHVLRSVGELFKLNPHEWVWLWRMTWRHDPPQPIYPEQNDELDGTWQHVIDSVPHAVYITNHRWDVVAFNSRFPRLFPGQEYPANTMEYMLLDPAARRLLPDWDSAWAPFIVPQLWAGRAAYPDDERIADIVRRVLEDTVTGPFYRDFGPVFVHPDGTCRPFNHPEHGIGWVSLATSSPLSSSRFITMTMIFTPGAERPVSPPPIRAICDGT
ncbi:helix-turn-helix transcriptional regulator [Streptomyces flaveolus]|uniref:Helix-turn-helix transcriptional regulator n=1 Tax=Streptomyces flaveolus TaxID=67297 RepID=A0ABV1VF33_9ACTN